MPTSITPEYLRPRLLHRENESHKGDYGHLLIVAGCETMPGAAVLATGAALKSGCGLVTVHSTKRALQAVVNNYPSAMLSEDPRPQFSRVPDNLSRYTAIAIGPGLSRDALSGITLRNLMDAAKEAKERQVTRATVSMERAAALDVPVIFAIGNAPTALIQLHEMMESGKFTPEFVIGVPVGFVNVVAAKELFLNSNVPFIINKGRKGGSNIAAAIVNAILYNIDK